MGKKISGLVITLILGAIIFILLAALFKIENTESNIWLSICETVFTALGSLFGVSAIWELTSRNKFIKDMLDIKVIGESSVKSGFYEYEEDFKYLNWKQVFENASKMELYFSYANTWYSNNMSLIKNYLKKGGKLKVYLPDHRQDLVINTLNQRFSYGEYSKDKSHPEDCVKIRIEKTIRTLKGLGKNVEIFLYSGTFQSSYYILDKKELIFAPQKHGIEKEYVPAFRVKKGLLYKWIIEDTLRIKKISEKY